ncbi:MAG: hypothetical protein U9N59_07050 [Campylobacterota bacterium]|nr:hypothetical protein [Campylobacterota bacterium]
MLREVLRLTKNNPQFESDLDKSLNNNIETNIKGSHIQIATNKEKTCLDCSLTRYDKFPKHIIYCKKAPIMIIHPNDLKKLTCKHFTLKETNTQGNK